MTEHNGHLPEGFAVDCNSTDGNAASTTVGDQTYNCSAGVHLTVAMGEGNDDTTYVISASHKDGTKTYTYNSKTDAALKSN